MKYNPLYVQVVKGTHDQARLLNASIKKSVLLSSDCKQSKIHILHNDV